MIDQDKLRGEPSGKRWDRERRHWYCIDCGATCGSGQVHAMCPNCDKKERLRKAKR